MKRFKTGIAVDKNKERTLKQLRRIGEKAHSYSLEKLDLLILNKCNLCDSHDVSLISELYLKCKLIFFSTSVCNRCLYVFRTISPSFEWFKKCWKQIATDTVEVFNPETEDIRKRRYGEIYQLLSKYCTRGHVLDVGSAYGTGAKVFQKHGFVVEAIEPEDNKANYIQNFFNIHNVARSIEDFVLKGKKYDLIILAHCLEHLDDPIFVISHLSNILHPNGIVYVEVPILWKYVTWSDALYLTHKSNFTEENIAYLFAKHGFEGLEKADMCHTKAEPSNLGLVLRQRKYNKIRSRPNFKENHNPDDVHQLYRKYLPLSKTPPLNQVLKYTVNSIEHFYQTIRLDNKEVVEPRNELNFISFRSI